MSLMLRYPWLQIQFAALEEIVRSIQLHSGLALHWELLYHHHEDVRRWRTFEQQQLGYTATPLHEGSTHTKTYEDIQVSGCHYRLAYFMNDGFDMMGVWVNEERRVLYSETCQIPPTPIHKLPLRHQANIRQGISGWFMH